MSTTGTGPDASRPSHRVKYAMVVAVSIVVAIAAVVVVVADVPGRISRGLSGAASEPLFSAQRLDAELDAVRARLGELPMRR
ncbi:MAG: hypothetical protein K0R33_2388, partial [Mycobacterium sp.]|nr:hypothetical protein [Mycobacterium sp.]